MFTFMVEYTEDKGETLKVMLVSALDKTKAYLSACFVLPITAAITDVCEI